MDIAHRENVTPVEALLSLVQRAYGRSAYMDSVLTEAMRKHVDNGGSPLELDAHMMGLWRESRKELLNAAKVSQQAVSAGAMVALTARADLDGTLVADALTAALDVLALDPDERMRALGAAQERLLGGA